MTKNNLETPLTFEEIDREHRDRYLELQQQANEALKKADQAQRLLDRVPVDVQEMVRENLRLKNIHKNIACAAANAQCAGKLLQSGDLEGLLRDAGYELPRPPYQDATEPSYAELRRLHAYWYARAMRAEKLLDTHGITQA